MEILMFIVVVIVLIAYFMTRKTTKKFNNQSMSYDLVIKFDESSYCDIRKLDSFSTIASWTKYGSYGFRGFSKLNKEELVEYISKTLRLSDEAFQVISANPGLYIPS